MQPVQSNKVFIKNINYATTNETLGKAMESFGALETVFLLTETIRGVKRSRGIGFAVFVNPADCKKCIDSKQLALDGRNILFSEARPPRPKVTAFFGKLADSVDEPKILTLLKKEEVESVKIIPKRERPSGFAFVTFKNADFCAKAIDSLKAAKLDGAEIIVRFARPPRNNRRRFNRKPTGPRRAQKAE